MGEFERGKEYRSGPPGYVVVVFVGGSEAFRHFIPSRLATVTMTCLRPFAPKDDPSSFSFTVLVE